MHGREEASYPSDMPELSPDKHVLPTNLILQILLQLTEYVHRFSIENDVQIVLEIQELKIVKKYI